MIDSSSCSSITVDVLVIVVAALLWSIYISIYIYLWLSLFDIIVADPVQKRYGMNSTNGSDEYTIDTIQYRWMYIVVTVVGFHYVYNIYKYKIDRMDE